MQSEAKGVSITDDNPGRSTRIRTNLVFFSHSSSLLEWRLYIGVAEAPPPPLFFPSPPFSFFTPLLFSSPLFVLFFYFLLFLVSASDFLSLLPSSTTPPLHLLRPLVPAVLPLHLLWQASCFTLANFLTTYYISPIFTPNSCCTNYISGKKQLRNQRLQQTEFTLLNNRLFHRPLLHPTALVLANPYTKRLCTACTPVPWHKPNGGIWLAGLPKAKLLLSKN